MSTVVAQPHSTAGNGGRKLVRLSNDWEVAVTKITDYFYFHVNKKDGNGWNPLCYMYHAETILNNDISIVSKGTAVYVIQGQSTVYISSHWFDATTVENVNIYGNNFAVVEDATQTALGSVTLAINPQGTELHAAWSSINSTHPSAFNIRCAKGAINGDGSVSWGAVEHVTISNSNGYDFKNPSIVITKNNNPSIICNYTNGGAAYYIVNLTKEYATRETPSFTSTWGNKVVYYVGAYVQSFPSVVIDKDGAIHVAWHGTDATDNSNAYIRFSKSIDGGVNWSTMQKLVEGGYPTFTTDKTGKCVIVYHYGGMVKQIESLDKDDTWTTPITVASGTHASALYDATFTGAFGATPPTIHQDGVAGMVKYIGTYTVNNAPTLMLNTQNNRTLYENDTFKIDGTTTDTDNGDALTIKYQVDSGAVRNLHSAISDGVNPIPFSKNLTYSEGILKDGNTAITSVLSEGTPHTLSVWAEDGNGGKSDVLTRTFFVVPNRPPTITVDPIAAQTDLINSNVLNVSGAVGDADNNDVIVTFQINDAEPQQIYNGPPSSWTFNIALKDLRTGANTIMIKATDIYNAEISKVLTINKTHNAVPINEAIALYKITPPTGSASKILLWIERMLGDLAVTAQVSMTNEGEPEDFVSLPRISTAPKDGLQEDEFYYDALAEKTNIVVKIIYNRTSSAAVETIKKISGVLS